MAKTGTNGRLFLSKGYSAKTTPQTDYTPSPKGPVGIQAPAPTVRSALLSSENTKKSA